MFTTSIIQNVDSYKASHWKQYPENTTFNYAYFEARRGGEHKNIVFFGLQYILKEYLTRRITKEEVEEAAKFFEAHGEPFNYDGWMKIVNDHDGKLPVRIRAVPEGTVVPEDNVLFTVENTDPELAWLTSYLETMLARVWYPCTVATRSWACRRVIMEYLKKTSDNPEQEIGFKLHDFGSRGVSSEEQAAIGGAAHLVNFLGTDTVSGVVLLQRYYNAEMAGFSIPAAEHSTMSPYGREGEVDAFRNMIKQYGHLQLVAVVSDTWDIYNACENLWGKALKQEVEDMEAMLVVRPDSGDPVEVVENVVKILAEKFGTSQNAKGYKVLNNVRVIQGDGMDPDQIRRVYRKLYEEGFAADNLAVGMGAGLLQKLNRDTCRFAYKTSYMVIDGKGVEVYKEPATDKSKKSKRGMLSLIEKNGYLMTVPKQDFGDLLEVVFENGELIKEHTLDEIRERASKEPVTI